jgi:hypothetical protein
VEDNQKEFRISDFGFRICRGRSAFRHGLLLGGRLLTFGRVERPLQVPSDFGFRICRGRSAFRP